MEQTTNINKQFDFKWEIAHLPECPGVYIMRNKQGTPIYVGKAVSLKNRVSQYFHKSTNHTERITRMISHIHSFEYIVTSTETEALVLECTLIKKYHPKYNVMMKDGKTYPMIEVNIGERYPTVNYTRDVSKKNTLYFGPFPNISAAYQVLNIFKEVYPTKACSRKFPAEGNIGERGCINYEIGKCPGCCRDEISDEEYAARIDSIVSFLRGNSESVILEYKRQMDEASEKLDFERAAFLRDRIKSIRLVTQKQRVYLRNGENTDIFAFATDEGRFCVEVFFIRDGKINGRDSFIADNTGEYTGSEAISSFIKQLYSENVVIPTEISVSDMIDDREVVEKWLTQKAGKKVRIFVPHRGDKVKIIDMVRDNAVIALQQYKESIKKDTSLVRDALLSLTRKLALDAIPSRIEAYDISNTGNTDIVGGMVVFKDGFPEKKSYRRFKIRSVDTQNDYESMREVIERRFLHEKDGFAEDADLILLDGGKGHVNCIKSKLTEMNIEVPVFGIVKDSKHRTRAMTSDSTEINISDDIQLMRFMASIQDEIHRYTIEYNKKLRSSKIKDSSMKSIKGVGEKRKIALYKHFGSMTAIKKASIEELCAAEGIDSKTAKAVYDFYHKDIKE